MSALVRGEPDLGETTSEQPFFENKSWLWFSDWLGQLVFAGLLYKLYMYSKLFIHYLSQQLKLVMFCSLIWSTKLACILTEQ